MLSPLASNPGPRRFVPSDLPNLAAWWRPDRITGLVNNDPISTWADSSSAGRDATGSGANRPTWIASGLNGLPTVRFTAASSQRLAFTSWSPGNFTCFYVHQSAGDVAFLGRTANTNSQMRIGQGGANVLSTFDSINSSISSAMTVARTSWAVCEFNRSSSTVSFYQNGRPFGTGTFAVAPTFDTLGALTNTVIPFSGDMADVILVASALSDANRYKVYAYLMDRYAL